ncbi:MAG: hypothetical protein H6978_09875 [Gammaproteobacteria bacterium]|nr:hypothetical protein [Gammaproteobacteria bacterium]
MSALPSLLTALQQEAATLRHWQRTHPLSVQVTGPGPVAAESHATRIIAAGHAPLLVWGVAGSLHDEFAAGTLVIADEVIYQGRKYRPDPDLNTQLHRGLAAAMPRRAALLCMDQPLWTEDEKRQHAAATDTALVDTESGAVAAAAARHQVPFAVIRVVVDNVTATLPACTRDALQEDGSIAVGRVIAGLARAPSELGALLALARAQRMALNRLHSAARMLAQLHWTPPGPAR